MLSFTIFRAPKYQQPHAAFSLLVQPPCFAHMLCVEWDTSSVTTLSKTFQRADAFNVDIRGAWFHFQHFERQRPATPRRLSLPMQPPFFAHAGVEWDTSSVTNLGSTFREGRVDGPLASRSLLYPWQLCLHNTHSWAHGVQASRYQGRPPSTPVRQPPMMTMVTWSEGIDPDPLITTVCAGDLKLHWV